jgi:hypothetical protein
MKESTKMDDTLDYNKYNTHGEGSWESFEWYKRVKATDELRSMEDVSYLCALYSDKL